MDSKNIKYLMLTIILLILSGFGIFLISKINNPSIPTQIAEVTPIPTEIIPTKIPTTSVTPIASATPTKKITVTPTATPTTKITPTATPSAKTTPTITPTPTATTSSQLVFRSTQDSFSIVYGSSRKLYQDTETSGNRYTFYSILGNFAVHVSPSGTWAWTNPDRNFSTAFIVSGQNTYRYDISTQTIVDLQSTTKNYTIQCVHNGLASLKTECETFIKSFQLL